MWFSDGSDMVPIRFIYLMNASGMFVNASCIGHLFSIFSISSARSEKFIPQHRSDGSVDRYGFLKPGIDHLQSLLFYGCLFSQTPCSIVRRNHLISPIRLQPKFICCNCAMACGFCIICCTYSDRVGPTINNNNNNKIQQVFLKACRQKNRQLPLKMSEETLNGPSDMQIIHTSVLSWFHVAAAAASCRHTCSERFVGLRHHVGILHHLLCLTQAPRSFWRATRPDPVTDSLPAASSAGCSSSGQGLLAPLRADLNYQACRKS